MRMPFKTIASRLAVWAVSAAVSLASAGCVERVLRITTDPPGATIYVNGQERASTTAERPLVEIPFLWYGNYEITVRRDGYVTEQAIYSANPPWYQLIPIDLVVESLPVNFRDVHVVPPIAMRPREGPPANEAERLQRRDALIDRAEELRQRVIP
jgi:hypothetical protein